jgi:hypothetical protein
LDERMRPLDVFMNRLLVLGGIGSVTTTGARLMLRPSLQ